MFNTVEDFTKSNTTSCVKVVRCVVFTDDTTTFQVIRNYNWWTLLIYFEASF